MKKLTLFKRKTGALSLSLLLLASTQTVFAEDDVEPAPANPYSSMKTIVLEDGTSLDIVIANSPATPPGGVAASASFARTPLQKTGDVTIAGVPAFDWSYGSSATAGAMIAGYYDRVGFADMYTGPTGGGCMPLTNVSWGSNECPLSATKNGLDGRTTRGHVDDYYNTQGAVGPDPYVVNSWTEHTIGDCTGDYMKTSKWFPGSSSEPVFAADINKDGAAVFILDSSGAPMSASTLETNTYSQYDAGYGLKLFFESRGYTVSAMYNQYINPVKAGGFTYDQYKAEIDAGRPVMLHLSGHIVTGIGYNDLTGNEIIFHDSWSYEKHTMTWGGTYNTLFTHNAVTIVALANAIDPDAGCGRKFPWNMFLPAILRIK
jgi:Peptidase_C39 like family